MSSKLPKIRTASQLRIGRLKLTEPRNSRSGGFSPKKDENNNIVAGRAPTYSLRDQIDKKRTQLYSSVLDFKFNMNRLRMLSNHSINEKITGGGVLYWMSREQRVQDNWSFLYAQKLAMETKQPLYVCFCMVPTFLDATYRMYHFMIEGLKEVKAELDNLRIPFHILVGQASSQLPILVNQNTISSIVCDFTPLRIGRQWIETLKKSLPATTRLIEVDGHNLVPCWYISNKVEEGAYTIRPKLAAKLGEFMTEFPPVVAQRELNSPLNLKGLTYFDTIDKYYDILEVDKKVGVVGWATPGYSGGIQAFQDFIDDEERLRIYDFARNEPNARAQSGLSPWLHFGQIGAQRCALEAKKYVKEFAEGAEWFLEALIIRRDLADNYCYYEPNYDNLRGAPKWAQDSLRRHASDRREYIYSKQQLEQALTHDSLWNACQIQLLVEGKIHGYLRMYWSKKILEWMSDVDESIAFCIYLNDKYSLDGRDPNGYVGALSSMAGLHDKGFDDRPVHGRVRGLTNQGCRKKFDVERFASRYNHELWRDELKSMFN